MSPLWLGIAFAILLLLLGLFGLGVGALLIFQQLRKRQVNQTHRAKKIAEIRQLPHRTTQIVSASQRPTMPLMMAPELDRRPDPGGHPTLAPEEEPEVPTAVFRPSQYKDIEALLKDADKYVERHKK